MAKMNTVKYLTIYIKYIVHCTNMHTTELSSYKFNLLRSYIHTPTFAVNTFT